MMHKETYELQRIQENCSDFLQIIVDKMNKKPRKDVHILRDIYQNQFIYINDNQLWSSTMKCGKGKKRK